MNWLVINLHWMVATYTKSNDIISCQQKKGDGVYTQNVGRGITILVFSWHFALQNHTFPIYLRIKLIEIGTNVWSLAIKSVTVGDVYYRSRSSRHVLTSWSAGAHSWWVVPWRTSPRPRVSSFLQTHSAPCLPVYRHVQCKYTSIPHIPHRDRDISPVVDY